MKTKIVKNKIFLVIIFIFIIFNISQALTIDELIEYTKKYKNISLEYDIHPFIVFGIAWQETKFNPLTININKINVKLTKKKYYEFINIFNYLFNNQTTVVSVFKLNCDFYQNNKLLFKKTYLFYPGQNEKNNNILKDFIQLKRSDFNIVYVRSNYPLPFFFDNKYNATLYTTRLVEIIDNIDIGLTQINNKFWLKPNNIPPASIFEPEFAIMFSSKILADLREETNSNLYKMVKYYHSRTKGIGDRYAKSTIATINSFTKMFNSYVRYTNNTREKTVVAKSPHNIAMESESDTLKSKESTVNNISITKVLAENNIIILN